jgi:hypothetical protein
MPAGKKPGSDHRRSTCDEDTENIKMDSLVDERAGGSVLDEQVRVQLGRQLSAYYSNLVNQPIPDTFIELLKKLEKSDTTEKGE